MKLHIGGIFLCGIGGIISYENDVRERRYVLDGIVEVLKLRGPNEHGIYVDEDCGLAHTRLNILDIEGGKQPMEYVEDGKAYYIVCDGAIYNTTELRRELYSKGYNFKSHSDIEVILKAYVEWKEECVNKLNGVFAFAIWDKTERKLFLTRDRLGVKPLFYTETKDGIVFGSEIKAVFVDRSVKHELTYEGLAEVFMLGPSRVPGSGVFRNIKEVEPGHYMIIEPHKKQIKEYWRLVSHEHEDDFETTVNKVRDLVIDATIRQTVSDVDVCTLLSGGLDSSIVTAIVQETFREKGKTLKTISVDYEDNDKFFKSSAFQPNSDEKWINLMVDTFKTEHTTIKISNELLAHSLCNAMTARDLPGMADIDSSLLLFCKEIKKYATVAMGGECADEVFGGYPWFHRVELMDSDFFPWIKSLDERASLLNDEVLENIDVKHFARNVYEKEIANVPTYEGDSSKEKRIREINYLTHRWFMRTLIDRQDRMSSVAGLDVRVPFCDYRIVEYAWNIPWEMKAYNGREKGLLREAFKGMLPDEIIERKKSPYPKTHNPSYLHEVQRELSHIMETPTSPILEIINKEKVNELLSIKEGSTARPWFGQLMTEPQVMAFLIQVNQWLKKYKIDIV